MPKASKASRSKPAKAPSPASPTDTSEGSASMDSAASPNAESGDSVKLRSKQRRNPVVDSTSSESDASSSSDSQSSSSIAETSTTTTTTTSASTTEDSPKQRPKSRRPRAVPDSDSTESDEESASETDSSNSGDPEDIKTATKIVQKEHRTQEQQNKKNASAEEKLKAKRLAELRAALRSYEQVAGSSPLDHLSPDYDPNVLSLRSPTTVTEDVPNKTSRRKKDATAAIPQKVCAVLSPPPAIHFAKDTKSPSIKKPTKSTKARTHFDKHNGNASLSLSGLSLSGLFKEQISSPISKAAEQLVKPKRNWLIVGLLIVIGVLVAHQRPDMPPGLVVDDPKRPGVLFNRSSIKIKRPVALIPGFVTSALEVWESDECAVPFGSSGTLFRERMFGTQMLLHLLNRPQCYMKQFGLHPVNYGADPDPANKSSGRYIRTRPAGWLDSADYFVPGYWVWAKMIRNLADIGYDPSDMMLFPYDWRLNGNMTEVRDGYFHRLKVNIEEMFRLSNEIKVVMVSHSYGGTIKNEFFKWVENVEEGWVNKHVHASVFIGAPMLGVTKAGSALLSGEMRDLTSLPIVAQAILNLYMPRMWRSEVFRSWPCLEAMLLRGCDSLWPNVVSMFNQSVILRMSDVYEAIETVSGQAGHHGLANHVAESKKVAHLLPHIPRSPDMKVFVLYGTGLGTEVGYAYTLDEDDIGGEEAAVTASEGTVPFDASEGTSWLQYFRLGGDTKDVPLGRKFTKRNGKSGAQNKNQRSKPTLENMAADDENSSSGWSQYVESLGVFVRDMTQKVINLGDSDVEVNESVPSATKEKGTARRGALWSDAFLGNRTTGNALMVDNSMNGVKVAPAQAIPGAATPRPNVAGISRRDTHYEGGVQLGVGDGTVPLMSLGFMARAPDGWVKDVRSVVTKEYLHLHDAEAHEKLLKLREERNRRRGEAPPTLVETNGYLSPVTNETEEAIQAVAETVADAVTDAKNETFVFTSYLNKLLDIRLPNISSLSTAEIEHLLTSAATDFYTATDSLLQTVRDGVTKAMDIRGGGTSSDHVDMMGNYEMLMDVLNIATGNEDKVHERIITDIDQRIADSKCKA